MNNKYKILDILEAVNTLLDDNKKKPLKLENVEENPLKLTNQVKSLKTGIHNVPKDTEEIILQAEKYLKK